MKKISYFFLLVLLACSPKSQRNEKPQLFVAIEPIRFLAEQIAGDKLSIKSLIPPGGEPHTFEITPADVAELAHTPLYFSLNMPFENELLKRTQDINPQLKTVDLTNGISLRQMENADGLLEKMGFIAEKTVPAEEEHSGTDPHIWLAPQNAIQIAATITAELCLYDSLHANYYTDRFDSLKIALVNLHNELSQELSLLPNKNFLVFHPAWGYFAWEFGLQQIPIEVEGKITSAALLEKIINFAKKNEIKVVFVQKQIMAKEAQTVAEAINGNVFPLDPLAYDYFTNLKDVAKSLRTK